MYQQNDDIYQILLAENKTRFDKNETKREYYYLILLCYLLIIMQKQIQGIKQPQTSLNINITLDDLENIKPTYQGIISDVFKVVKNDKKYAVKLIYIERIEGDLNQQLNTIMIEIKTLYSIKHQNIIQLLGHFNEDGKIGLIFPFFGQTLTQFIVERKKKKKPNVKFLIKDFIKIFRGVGSAISQLHAMGFIHRDISADNILVDENYNIKLIDLGSIGNIQYSKGTFGTQQYIAPQIRLKKVYNQKVDVWSFGILCYQLLYYKHLFKPKNGLPEDQINDQYLKNMKQPIEDPSADRLLLDQKPSQQLITLIKSMVQFNPDKRPEIGYLLSKKLFGAEERQELSYSMDEYVRSKTYKTNKLPNNIKQKSIAQLEQELMNILKQIGREEKKGAQLLLKHAKICENTIKSLLNQEQSQKINDDQFF